MSDAAQDAQIRQLSQCVDSDSSLQDDAASTQLQSQSVVMLLRSALLTLKLAVLAGSFHGQIPAVHFAKSALWTTMMHIGRSLRQLDCQDRESASTDSGDGKGSEARAFQPSSSKSYGPALVGPSATSSESKSPSRGPLATSPVSKGLQAKSPDPSSPQGSGSAPESRSPGSTSPSQSHQHSTASEEAEELQLGTTVIHLLMPLLEDNSALTVMETDLQILICCLMIKSLLPRSKPSLFRAVAREVLSWSEIPAPP